MTTMNLKSITRTYRNNGQHAEQVARFTLTGKIEKADNKPFWMGGDCGDLQIKSARATVCNGTDIQAHLKRDAATMYGYVTKDFQTMYVMTKQEYQAFCETFKTVTTDSRTKKAKIRLKSESKAMIDWLVRSL